jgi:hypothetical protein
LRQLVNLSTGQVRHFLYLPYAPQEVIRIIDAI